MKSNLLPKHWLLGALVALFILYCLFQARALVFGPQIWIDSPRDGEAITSPVVIISGHAKNAAWISLNDRQIFTDEQGLWSEKLIVAQGLSIMTVRVRDRFGRQSSKSVRVLLN